MNARPKLTAAVLFLLAAGLAACLPAGARAVDQPALTLSASPAVVVAGQPVSLLGTFPGVSGAELTLSRMRAGETEFTPVVSGRLTNAGGNVVWTVRPAMTTTYRVDLTAAGTWTAASAETAISVRPRITLTTAAPKPLLENQYVRYAVKVRPAHPGATVQLARWTADGWVALKDLTLDGDSQASVRILAGSPGRLAVRADMAADLDHIAGHSLPWRVTVYDKRNPYGTPTRLPHLVLVDLSQYKLYYHEHGNIVRVFDCVLGRPSLPTPRGHFRIYAKDTGMSGPYGPFRMRYRGLYAIHGTNEPWLLNRFPRNYSHGCTRLANANVTWLFSRVHVGTPVWNVP